MTCRAGDQAQCRAEGVPPRQRRRDRETHHYFSGRSRRTVSRALRGLAVILVLASALWRAAPVDAASEPTTYYLSLGDSLAQGLQPIGGPHTNSAAVGYSQGYANQLFKQARTGAESTSVWSSWAVAAKPRRA